jgi:cation diffusion facilitator family transporter
MTEVAQDTTTQSEPRRSLTPFAWMSIGAAVVTIGLKTGAWLMTGSVGLLSDAAESGVNLVAAIVALIALRVAARPPDESHHFGHAKAEYFSAGVEAVMIFLASIVIVITSVERFLNPRSLENIGFGLAISLVATAVNGFVGMRLLRAGRQYRSMTLLADGKHLLTDVWTSVGVVVGVGAVLLTHWNRLDSIVAFAVGVNILVMGWRLLTASVDGLMDHALADADHARIIGVLDGLCTDDVTFHTLQTRESGHRRLVSFHVVVPGTWTVQQANAVVAAAEEAVRDALEHAEVSTRLEPVGTPHRSDSTEGRVRMGGDPRGPG